MKTLEGAEPGYYLDAEGDFWQVREGEGDRYVGWWEVGAGTDDHGPYQVVTVQGLPVHPKDAEDGFYRVVGNDIRVEVLRGFWRNTGPIRGWVEASTAGDGVRLIKETS